MKLLLIASFISAGLFAHDIQKGYLSVDKPLPIGNSTAVYEQTFQLQTPNVKVGE